MSNLSLPKSRSVFLPAVPTEMQNGTKVEQYLRTLKTALETKFIDTFDNINYTLQYAVTDTSTLATNAYVATYVSTYISTYNAMLLTGDQTAAGTKTFTTTPILPSANPTTVTEAAHKGYVDTGLSTKLSVPVSSARGDLIYHNASTYTRLSAGTAGQYLKTYGTTADPAWSSVGGGFMFIGTSVATVSSPASGTWYDLNVSTWVGTSRNFVTFRVGSGQDANCTINFRPYTTHEGEMLSTGSPAVVWAISAATTGPLSYTPVIMTDTSGKVQYRSNGAPGIMTLYIELMTYCAIGST